ncbi:MAG TPA: MBL fold metallo-hydrolase [Bacillota bacterium]|nr:MBL fold metallo-hydrolase [Bacillota bacterium]HOI37300.1 MBL fold metallo-hydrolase [Bacillota bacterium]
MALPRNTTRMKAQGPSARNRTLIHRALIQPLLIMVAACILLCVSLPLAAGPGSTAGPSSETALSGSVLFTFLDVGQGDAILVSTSDGHHMLVDGGPRSAGLGLAARLRELGIKHLDVLVSTHPHEDHIGGLADVLNAVTVGRVIDSGKVHTSATYERYLTIIDEKNIPFALGRANDWFLLGDAGVQIIWPTGALAEDMNDVSVVLRVDYGKSSALLTGDIGPDVEQYLAEHEALSRVVLLKVAHHGSRRSTTPEFLRQVRPRVAVTECATANSYGHPHFETLARLILNQTLIYRTDQHGEVAVKLTANPQVWSALIEKRGADYRGSSSSTVFHFAWCDRARSIDPARVVVFSSRLQAEDAGYRPCQVCRP